ncbi:MAG: DUF3108 domain-containing protein [Flavobacteriales bacterium]|jgi:hypothetical protein|nr:DUF3108 domain-containing protein [Flavobacteriales bacterium]
MKLLTTFAISLLTLGSISASDGVYNQQLEASAFKYRTIKNTAFQAGEKLTYRLHYGVIDAAQATLEVKKVDRKISGRSLYRVIGKGKSIGSFNWFFKVDDRYESYIDEQGIFPWVFIRRVNEGGYKINQDYTFIQSKGKVKEGEKEYKAPTNVQDMISSYYYARTLDFSNAKKGDIFEFDSFVDGEVYPLKIKFLGREKVKIRKGKYNALKFSPVVQVDRIFKNEDDLQVWISDDANKIPLLAKAKILFGSIKMELTAYEGLKNELSKIEK